MSEDLFIYAIAVMCSTTGYIIGYIFGKREKQ